MKDNDKLVNKTKRENWKKKYNELNVEYENIKNKNLYLLADIQNMQKQIVYKINQANMKLFKSFALSLIEIIDDYERVIKHEQSESILMIYNKFKSILTKYSIKEIPLSEGNDFDTNTQEAVSIIPINEPEKDNKIISIIQKGYQIENNTIIRYAKVVIGKYTEN